MTIHLIANSKCEMADLKSAAIAEAVRMAAPQCGTNQAAAITISLECWRDENNKLHCKLSVSLGVA